MATSISIYTNAGLEVLPQQTRRCFASHHDLLNPKPGHIFLLGYVKDSVFLLPVQQELLELRRRFIAAIVEINGDVLQRIWTEMDYRLDVCPDTKGGHVEHL
jgi:hypothetical protein